MLNNGNVRSKRINVNQTIGYNYTGNTNALFNVVDRHAVHIKLPASAYVAAQCKATAIAN